MITPNNLKYSRTHEWVEFTSETSAKVGLTDYAQQSLGGIVYVDLPNVGDAVTAGKSFSDLESVKMVVEIYSPVSGTIAEINEAVLDQPELINEAPYDTWLIHVTDITSRGDLLDDAAYEVVCKEEEESK